MSWFITKLISAFLLPPLSLLLVAVLGLWLWSRRPRFARVLVTASVAALWLLSTPLVSEGLLHMLEGSPNTVDTRNAPADAIVVLGGGTYFHAPEYGGDTVSLETLGRLRYAAKLERDTGRPILVSGGAPLGNKVSEAEQMKQVLESEFNVPVRWAETASSNTMEDARLSREILMPENIRRIYLVTQAWHMPRAARIFRNAGFEVIPAPTGYTTRYRIDLLDFLPDASALHDSRIFLHELIGMLWYRLKS